MPSIIWGLVTLMSSLNVCKKESGSIYGKDRWACSNRYACRYVGDLPLDSYVLYMYKNSTCNSLLSDSCTIYIESFGNLIRLAERQEPHS
jgi:hypothetical protein